MAQRQSTCNNSPRIVDGISVGREHFQRHGLGRNLKKNKGQGGNLLSFVWYFEFCLLLSFVCFCHCYVVPQVSIGTSLKSRRCQSISGFERSFFTNPPTTWWPFTAAPKKHQEGHLRWDSLGFLDAQFSAAMFVCFGWIFERLTPSKMNISLEKWWEWKTICLTLTFFEMDPFQRTF